MRKKGNIFIKMGLLLIAAALFLTGYNLWESHQAQMQSLEVKEVLMAQIPKEQGSEEFLLPEYVKNPKIEMPEEEIEGISYIGVWKAQTLGLELPVISTWSYPNLRKAPCRYSGSAYLDNLILCAHNYGSHFGNLKDLRSGDLVTFTDVDGNVFEYEVVQIEILEPTAVEELETGDWALTLFTCTLGGKTRVVVRCEKREIS